MVSDPFHFLEFNQTLRLQVYVLGQPDTLLDPKLQDLVYGTVDGAGTVYMVAAAGS